MQNETEHQDELTPKSETVRVVFLPVGKEAEVLTLPRHTLNEELHRLCEGWMDFPRVGPHVTIAVNDTGRITGMPPNRIVPHWGPLYGPMVVLRHDDAGESVDVTDTDVEIAKTLPQFFTLGGLAGLKDVVTSILAADVVVNIPKDQLN